MRRFFSLLPALALAGCASDYDAQRREAAAAREAMAFDLAFDTKYGWMARAERDDGVAHLGSRVTVDDVVEAARRRNPSLVAALERWVAALEREPQVTALPDPLVSYRYSSMFRMHTVGVEQPLPWPGKLAAEGRAALAAARAERADWREQDNALRAQATTAVAALWMARRELALLEENLALLERFIAIAETKYAAGTVTQSDVLRAQVEREGLLAEQAAFRREVAVAEAALNALLDRRVDAPLGPVDDLPAAGPPAPLASLLLDAFRARPALASATERAAAAEELRDRADLEWVPDVVLGGAYVRDFGMDEDEVELMGGVRLPVWFGRIQGARDEAHARLRGAEAETRAAYNRVAEEVRSAAARLEAAVARRRILEQGAVPRARQTVEVSEAAYVSGQLDLLGLIDAQRQLLTQELGLARAVAEQVAARAALDRATGVGQRR